MIPSRRGVTLTVYAQVGTNDPHPVTAVTVHTQRDANRVVANALRSVANVIDEQSAFEELVAHWPEEPEDG